VKATFEARVADRSLYPLFDDIASLMSHVERRLYVDLYVHKRDANEVKREALVAYGVTGRQFNGVARALAGKVSASIESMKLYRSSLEERIASAKTWLKKKDRKIASLTKAIAAEGRRINPKSKRARPPNGAEMAKASKERSRLCMQVHHKRRYLASLEASLAKVSADIEAGNPRLCFGGRKLLSKQSHLEANGYSSHDEWRQAWRAKRANQFLCLGSHDERSGNQTLAYMPGGKLRLRVPPALEGKYGRWASFEAPVPNYGGDKLKAAWEADKPVTYRFLRRDNGWWCLQATIEDEPAPVTTIPSSGAIGADLNADHVAIGEVDRSGNYVWARSLPVAVYKRSHAQLEASLGDAAAEVVSVAKLTGKPVVAEKLDFAKKRSRLREIYGPKYARMLSGFAYRKFLSLLEARCAREGVELILVDPAFTSLVGLVKFAAGYGLTGHQAAAVAIARRGMGAREKSCKCNDDGACSHAPRPIGLSERLATKARNAPPLPARNRGGHVWSDWRRYAKKLREDFSLSSPREEKHSCGRRPSEGCGGGGPPPSSAAPARPATEEGLHGLPWDSAAQRARGSWVRSPAGSRERCSPGANREHGINFHVSRNGRYNTVGLACTSQTASSWLTSSHPSLANSTLASTNQLVTTEDGTA